MAFQREGVRFALRHGGRALIGDEMGLGKTVQVVPVLAAMAVGAYSGGLLQPQPPPTGQRMWAVW